MPKPSPAGYSRLQIRLHWAVVALVILQYLFHEAVAAAFDAGMETGTMTLTGGAVAHFVCGSAILILALWRLMLRAQVGVPDLPAEDPAWQKLLARGIHGLIYALLILLPFSGAAAWATASEGPSNAHEAMRAILIFAVLLHVAGSLYGQFVQKTGVLDRMRRPAD
jgi:cytochrome b561